MNLKYLLIGGEALNKTIVMNLYRSSYAPKNIINAYGPTEGTVFSLMHRVTETDIMETIASIPIGLPITGTQCYLLDNDKRVVPGEIGELCLSGECVAKGYFKMPQVTSEKFRTYTFNNKAIQLYQTGDLVRELANGEIEYLGRKDNQVKIRGYRIELNEVEACLQEFPNIAHASVLKHQSVPRGKYLIGYFSIKAGHFVKISELRSFMKKRLPEYMLPSFFISMDIMPINFSGKIDKDVLAKLHLQNRNSCNNSNSIELEVERILPRNKCEVVVAQIFTRLLELAEVFIDDDFFNLGGHSLLVLELLAEINRELSIQVKLSDILKHRTVRDIAKCLTDQLETKVNNLVRLKNGNSLFKLFLFHPIGGTAFCYMPLVKNLQINYSIYAFQDPAIDGDKTKFNSIEELAKCYLREIQAIQPHGPYNLMGSSFGATVMVEVIHQLEAQGEEVKVAAVVDGFACFALHKIQQVGITNLEEYLQEYLPRTAKKIDPFYDVMLERLKILLQYKTPKINTALALFKAKEVLPKFRLIDSKYNSWEKVTNSPILLYKVDGNHETMLLEPQVQDLSAQLSDYILSTEEMLQATG